MWKWLKAANPSWSFARGAWVAIATAVCGLFFLTMLSGAEEAYGLGTLLRWRGSIAPPAGVVVIGIGANPELTPLRDRRLECWPRALHAPLVKALADNDAAAIVFDLFFRTDGPDDEPLLQAMRAADRVIIMRQFNEVIRGNLRIPITQNPTAQFMQSAFAVSAPLFSLLSGRVTRMRTFDEDDNPMALAIALQMATRDLAEDWGRLLAGSAGFEVELGGWTDRTLVASMKALRAKLRKDGAAGQRLKQAVSALEPAKAKRLFALLDLYVGENDRLLNFRGPAGTIANKSYWSFIDVSSLSQQDSAVGSTLAGNAEKDAPCPVPLAGLTVRPLDLTDAERQEFRQKLVVIGATGNLEDTYETAFSPQVSGVEIFANALGDLAEGRSIRSSPVAEIVIVLSVAFLIGLAAASASSAILAATVTVVVFLVFGLGFWLLVFANTFIPVFTPSLVQVPAGVLFSAWTLWRDERTTRRSIERSLGQLFPAEMVRQLLGGPIPEGEIAPGEMRSIVCLATDAEGFVTVSERLPPNVLRRILFDYISTLQTAVRRRGGVIADISGDGLICYWLADRNVSEARRNGIEAALDMLDAVTAFNARHPQTPLPTRFGLHLGQAAFGPIASGGFFAPMLVGDVVNTAARLESLNKVLKTHVLASEDACADVAGIIIRRLGPALLKGRTEHIQAAEIMGRAAQIPHHADLAEKFALARGACKEATPMEAIERFAELLREFPADGPSQYFLEAARKTARDSSIQAGAFVLRDY